MKAPAGAARVDLTGKTIVPALVDAHVHLGYQAGLNFAAENFTRETLVDQLNRYAYSGVAAVLSLGTEPGDLPARIRAEQTAGRLGGALFLTAGRGIAAPNAGPGTPELKAAAYGVVTEDDARRAVREQVAHNMERSLATLNAAGMTIVLGTDVARCAITSTRSPRIASCSSWRTPG